MPSVALDTLISALGWIGALGAVVAYAMATRGTWPPRSLHFQATNLASATLLCLVAGYHEVWPSVAANIVWIGVGAQALTMIARAHLRRVRARRSSSNLSSGTTSDSEISLAA